MLRAYAAKQPARMRSFVAGIMRRSLILEGPSETRSILQKFTRVSDKAILQHTYDSEVQYMGPVPAPTAEGVRSFLEHLGVTGQPADAFIAEFIDNRFMNQLIGDGLFNQIYPGGMPTRG